MSSEKELKRYSNTAGGETIKIDIPKIPLADLPSGVIKLCSYANIQHLEGKLKTWADSVFTDEIQRKAAKDVLQDIARDFWRWLDTSKDNTTYKMVGYLLRELKKQEVKKLSN